MQEQSCPRCGMGQHQWSGNGGQGIEKDGRMYCCNGCATGSRCTCPGR